MVSVLVANWFRMTYCVCGHVRADHVSDRRCVEEGCTCKRFSKVRLTVV
jgi:hypothetical protein